MLFRSEGFGDISQGEGDDFTAVKQEVYLLFIKISPVDDAINFKIVGVNVRLGDVALKARNGHLSFKLIQLLSKVFTLHSFYAVAPNQGVDSQHQGNGALLAIHDILLVAIEMKDDGAEAVGGFVSESGDIREELSNVAVGPFVGALILGDDKVLVRQELTDRDDRFLKS